MADAKTDLETIKEILTKRGIEFTETADSLVFDERSRGVSGYTSEWIFNAAGELVEIYNFG